MSELDILINKATDGSLTNDNWQYILDVCDCISNNPETNTKEAIKLVQKRLAMKDANIILRTLSLLLAIAENCGSRMKQEIASSAFLQESLLKKLGDRKLHKQVKFRIAEVIGQLNSSFDSDPSLKPIKDAFSAMQSKYSQYVNSPPSKPEKQDLSAVDKKKEELELERALKLSIQEYERERSQKNLNSKPLPTLQGNKTEIALQKLLESIEQNPNSQRANNSSLEDPEAATIATVKKVCALYDLISYEPDELSFKKGDIITVIESVYRDWWKGLLPTGRVGIFPLNYVTPVVTKSPEEVSREIAMEKYFQDIKLRKVEKLLALLSTNPDQAPEETVTQLYNEIIPVRSNLAKFIDKYSTRKDELRDLHDKVNNETKVYDRLIDSIVGQNTHSLHVGPLPYPTNPDQANQLGDQGLKNGGYLDQQPTSAGFGNAYGIYSDRFVSTTYNQEFSGPPEGPEPYDQVSTPPRQVKRYPQYLR